MGNNLLSVPSGIESYIELVSNCFYVDKTLFIKEIWENKGSKVKLFTRPRRFGKTLTLNMVKSFFEKTNEDNSKYFKDKLIWKEGKKYQELQGKFPVIFVTLKDCTGFSFQNAFSLLKKTVAREFERHFDVVEKELKNKIKLKKYLKFMDGDMNIDDLKESFIFLSSVLKGIYGEKVIILIDEYDSPIQSGYKNSYYNQIIDLMRGFLSSCLKTNDDNLLFALLTGVLRVSKESLFSGLNNLRVFSVLDDKFSSFFGFTQEEVNNLSKYYGIEDKIPEIKSWYDGYQFGKTIIYNPWSVMNYIEQDCVPKPYWVDTANNSIIGKMISKADDDEIKDLDSLYRGESVFLEIDTEVTYKMIENNEASLLNFLLVTGYLTATEKTNTAGQREVRIPNKEIKGIYQKEIFSGVLHTNYSVKSFLSSLLDANKNKITSILSEVLKKSVSYFDTHENFYHGLLLGMLVTANDFFEVNSNKESGYGRFDIELLPYDKNRKAIIIELKSKNPADKKNIKILAKEALEQINSKEYFYNIKDKGYSGVIKIGIAFSKKNVEVAIGE